VINDLGVKRVPTETFCKHNMTLVSDMNFSPNFFRYFHFHSIVCLDVHLSGCTVAQILGLMASLVLFCCLRMDKFIDEE